MNSIKHKYINASQFKVEDQTHDAKPSQAVKPTIKLRSHYVIENHVRSASHKLTEAHFINALAEPNDGNHYKTASSQLSLEAQGDNA